MQRFITLVLTLFILFYGVQFGYKYFVGNASNEYTIQNENKYIVNETLEVGKNNVTDHYYLKITQDNSTFEYQIYEDLHKSERIIEDIKSYTDEQYKCIYPVLRSRNKIWDVTCLSDGIQYYYHDIKGMSAGLDEFVQSLTEYGYREDQFIDQEVESQANSNTTFYPYNIPEEIFFVFQNYVGVNFLNNYTASNLFSMTLFENDIYNTKLAAVVGKYYVVADYNSQYEFDNFHLIDITTLKDESIVYDKKISFDSYIQGVVDNSVYLYDKSNKKQYEINTKTKTIVETGNVDLKVKYYRNGVWETISAYDAANTELYFEMIKHSDKFSGYERVDEVGTFYYLYQKMPTGYRVYRANVQGNGVLTYLFDIPSIRGIQYIEDNVYYIAGNTVYSYNDMTGTRKLYQNPELSFNTSLIYGTYK